MTELLNEFVYVVSHPFFMMFYGLLIHFARKLLASKTRDTDSDPCLTDYWKKHPLKSMISVLGALAGYFMVAHYQDFATMNHEIQNSIRATALGVGFMADNLVDAFGEKALAKVKSI